MDYVRLGKTGMKVSRVCLGCMSFGGSGQRQAWSLGEEESRPIIKRALELGINFLDTANVYSIGASEEIVGRAVRDFGKREELVIATKVRQRMREGPNGAGLSRKNIMREIDDSLRRLQMDYVDLYQIHRLDPDTPMEEYLEALHDVVKSGKVRYIGASSMYAWQFAKLLYLADKNGWTRFVSMQDHYNLLNREEEREMIPLCRAEGIGVIPWSPLARGRLAREPEAADTTRSAVDGNFRSYYDPTAAADRGIVDAVGALAKAHGVPRAQIALAWMLHKPGITSPIVGVTKMYQLEDAVAAEKIKLTPAEMDQLEASYIPHAVTFAGVEEAGKVVG